MSIWAVSSHFMKQENECGCRNSNSCEPPLWGIFWRNVRSIKNLHILHLTHPCSSNDLKKETRFIVVAVALTCGDDTCPVKLSSLRWPYIIKPPPRRKTSAQSLASEIKLWSAHRSGKCSAGALHRGIAAGDSTRSSVLCVELKCISALHSAQYPTACCVGRCSATPGKSTGGFGKRVRL